MNRIVTILLTSVLVAATFSVRPVAAQDDGGGQEVYNQNCASCHQAGGSGLPPTFPPLVGNPRIGDAEYVEGVIRNGLQGPIEVDGVTYDGVMAALPQLSDDEIDAVIRYLQSLNAAPVTTTTSPPSEPSSGDAVNGELLFSGSVRLTEGGPACFSCHGAGSYSNSGAGLGPSLTDAHSRLGGDAGLSAWLANPPSQTMRPIYAERPLTETEIADLSAFLAVAPSAETSDVDGFLIGGLAGLAVLLGIVAVTFKRPKPTYVDRLRSRT